MKILYVLRTIIMYIYMFGYMLLYYPVLRRGEKALAAGDREALRQLEREAGVKLFSRTSRGVQLTREGEILYRYVKSGVENLMEGERMLENTGVFVCSVCGFVYVGDVPPEICPVCKVPSWKFDRVERRA